MKNSSSEKWYWSKIALLKKIGHYQRFLKYKEDMKKARPEITACRIMFQYLCSHNIAGYKPYYRKRSYNNAKH